MHQHQSVLRRVGWLLIAIGCVDIAFMIYCIANAWNYSSSFNIFSVVAGILLIRGSLKTARVIAWFLAFFLAGFGAMLIALPFLQPLDLSMAQVRSNLPVAAVALAIYSIVLALLVWIYIQLRSPDVLKASLSAGLKTSAPKSAFVLGMGLVATLAVAMQFMAHSKSAAKAVQLAREQVGPGYRFHLAGMRWTGNQISADVTAYNELQVKTLTVKWQQ
jgi:hypothetical protein